MTKGAKIAITAAFLGMVALAVTTQLEPEDERDPVRARAEQAEDEARLKQLAMYVALRTDVPFTEGGQLDVYRVVLDAEPNERAAIDVCFSARARSGPTIEEIKAGDYKRFPYARINWKFELRDGKTTAVLWDASPQSSGQRLVALDDGTSRTVPEAEFAAFLEAHAQ